MVKLDFKNILPRLGTQHESFEEFCCQIARHENMPDASEFIRIRGAGGDGGVECYWKRTDGAVSGWQAKYIFDFDQALQALSDSIRTALAVYPDLTQYIICLPYDLTGKKGRETKGQIGKFEEWKQNWENNALEEHRQLSIRLITASELMDRMAVIDPTNGKIFFWFNETFLSHDWFSNHLDEVRAAAKPRYTPDLRIETETSFAFEVLCGSKKWLTQVREKREALAEIQEDWDSCLASNDGGWGSVFPEALLPAGENLRLELATLKILLDKLQSAEGSSADLQLHEAAITALLSCESLVQQLREDLDARHGVGKADNASWKQFEAEYQVSFPAMHYDKATEISVFLSGLVDWVQSDLVCVSGNHGMVLAGDAGVGKTHLICDVADRRLEQRLYSIICFAEALPGLGDVADNIRTRIGLPATVSREQFLSILNTAGETSGEPLLVAIDGLNETHPRSYWLHQLQPFSSQVARFPYLRICFTCRSTYLDQIIPDNLFLPKVTHSGFTGMEFEASVEFFKHYNLEPPATPFLSQEFGNGLFLRLVCQAASGQGLKKLPSGWYGIRTAIDSFFEGKDKRFSQNFSVDIRYKFPSKAISTIANSISCSNARSIEFDSAAKLLLSQFPHAPTQLFEWLIEEGLLRIDAVYSGKACEEHVFLPFERIGDHLLAERLLSGYDETSINTAFDEGGQLHAKFNLQDSFSLAGLHEALALQIPERFGIELSDLVSDTNLETYCDQLLIRTLTWRDPDSFSEHTRDKLISLLTSGYPANEIFEQLLLIALVQSNIDALWMNDLLRSRTTTQLDTFLTKYLHRSFDDNGSVFQLVHRALNTDIQFLPVEATVRWLICLGWFCCASDRRVRDGATKGIVRLLTLKPELTYQFVSTFLDVSDEYILERVLASSYGALLRSKEKSVFIPVASLLQEQILCNSSQFANSLIRDHTRSIIECVAQFNSGFRCDRSIIEPPYTSQWPIEVPDEAELASLKSIDFGTQVLYQSCLQDDFFIYILSRLRPYEKLFPRHKMGAWIFKEAFRLGYRSESTKDFDGYLAYKHGSGRGRPKWAERIGKKYQWIALAHLAAHLSDNLNPEPDPWDESPLIAPLSFLSGRDIDPSLLVKQDHREKVQSWWSQYRYPHEKYEAISHKDWVSLEEDFPDLEQFIQLTDPVGIRWIALRHYPEWTSSSNKHESKFSMNRRQFWLHVESYIVGSTETDSLLDWADEANWFNQWMPRGRENYEGFFGEYPWGIPFKVEDSRDFLPVRPDNEVICPTQTYPAVNRLVAEHGYDCYQEMTVGINVPSSVFFGDGLTWRPENSYVRDGEVVFIDPTLDTPGPSALLVRQSHLEEWLVKNNKSIFFTMLGEKLYMGDNSMQRKIITSSAVFDGLEWRWSKVVKRNH